MKKGSHQEHKAKKGKSETLNTLRNHTLYQAADTYLVHTWEYPLGTFLSTH